jgi:ABC-type multidrug transport system fused ATPase/permease subunit
MEYNVLKSQVFSNVITFLQQGLAYGYLIYSVLNGRFGIGSFTMYLAAVNSFSGAMFAAMDSIVDIRRFSDYYSAVDDFLNMPKRQREGKTPLYKTFDESGFEPSAAKGRRSPWRGRFSKTRRW